MANSKELSVQAIIEKFRSSDATERVNFIKTLPLSKWAEEAEMAAKMNSPEMRANALDFASMGCIDNGAFELAAMLGEAGYRLAVEGYENRKGDKSVYRQIAGRNALNWMNALRQQAQEPEPEPKQRQTRHDEVATKIEEPIKWLTKHKDKHKEEDSDRKNKDDILGMLLLKQVEAQLDLENYDKAEELLKKIDEEDLSYFDRISYRSHQYRIEQHKPDVTKLSEEIEAPDLMKLWIKQEEEEDKVEDKKSSEKFKQQPQRDLDDLKELMSDIDDSGRLGELLIERVQEKLNLDQNAQADRSPRKIDYSEYKKAADQITEKMFSGSKNEFTVMQEIRDANYLFMNPQKGRDPTEIKKIIPVLQEAQKWMKEHNLPDYENDALWGLYLCYSRTKREPQAIEALQALRANLEEMREKISDPMKRAAINSRYPYLFASLCQLLCRSNQTAKLLDVMEGAKGRVLADVLTEKQAQITSDREFSEPAKQLPALMQQVNAHYLSYFVDDEATYAVLVAKDGSIHSEEIPIGKLQIREWLKFEDEQKKRDDPLYPLNWNKNRLIDQKQKTIINLSEKLTPFVSWLETFAKKGIIQKNDHICYCPDEELHLIPLHYLPFKEKYLINFVSVSRIQGALALVDILKREAFKPSQFIAIQVWTKKDLKSDKMLAAFGQVREWLNTHLSGTVLMGANIDLSTVVNQDFQQKVVHFNTHGDFPSLQEQDKRKRNPYSNSGLLLAKNGQLPPKAKITEEADLLSPKEVLKKENDKPKLNFDRSHVTLQACVSGRAKEGIGGDALGLEWAFLLNGASSLLASHWNVPADWAAKFSIKFYQKWLFENVSRAVAWRETVLELFSECESKELEKEHPERRAYYWAAFSLSGDWR